MPYNRRVFTTYLLGTAAVITLPSSLMAAVQRRSDLVVDALQWSEDAGANWRNDPVPEGASLLFQATIRNVGTAPIAIPKLLEVAFLVEGEEIDIAGQTASLAAGDSLTITGTQLWAATAGNHRIMARVDPRDFVRSGTSEGNNELEVTLSVVAADMALLAAAAAEDVCPISEEMRKVHAQGGGLSERPTWKTDEQVRMRDRMVKEDKVDPGTAALHAKRAVLDRIDMSMDEAHTLMAVAATLGASTIGDPDNRITQSIFAGTMIAAAVIAGDVKADATTRSLVGLGMAMAKMAGLAFAAFATGPVGFVTIAVDQMLGATLFPGANVVTTSQVGVSPSTGNPVGATTLPAQVGTVSNANFAGTTSAKAAAALKTWGWAARYFGNFANITVLGNGGMIHRYGQNSARVASQFYMYWGAMKAADGVWMSLWRKNFINYVGTNLQSGHMDPNDTGCIGGLFYGDMLGRRCYGRSLMAATGPDAKTRNELYTAARHVGFQGVPVDYNGVSFGPKNHSSTLAVPTNLQPNATNGDRMFSFRPRDGLGTLVYYTALASSEMPGSFTSYFINTAANMSKRFPNFGLQSALPQTAVILWRIFQAFWARKGNVPQTVNDIVSYLRGRDPSAAISVTGITTVVTDVLAGLSTVPELRRNFCQRALSIMEQGIGGPKIRVDVTAKQKTGTFGFGGAAPKADYMNDIRFIFSDWGRGVIPANSLILYRPATDEIIVNIPPH